MTTMTPTATQQPCRYINPVHAFFILLLGPAHSWDHPLIGTKYDFRYAELRHREGVARRRARAAQRQQRGPRATVAAI